MEEVLETHPVKRGKVRHAWRFTSLFTVYFFESTIDAVIDYAGVIAREKELFLGAALSLIGLFSFESDKFCDGNTAYYLSCTRPSTFYYFDALDITLIVIGVFFLLIWFLKHSKRSV